MPMACLAATEEQLTPVGKEGQAGTCGASWHGTSLDKDLGVLLSLCNVATCASA